MESLTKRGLINQTLILISEILLNDCIVGVVLLRAVEDISLQEECLLSGHADQVPVEGGPGTTDLRSED